MDERILYSRFPLDGVGRYFDIWLEKPLKDEAERQLLHRQVLRFLQFYGEALEYGEQFDAAGAIAEGLSALRPAVSTTEP